MTEMTQAASPDAMRAEADQLRAAARERTRTAYEEDRQAAQLAWEAGLIEERDMAADELRFARNGLPAAEQAVTQAIAAARAAEDRLLAEQAELARCSAERQKARDDLAPGRVQQDLAVAVAAQENVVSDCDAVFRRAKAAWDAARGDLDMQRAAEADASTEYAEAKRRAENPGTAPNMPGFAPGVSKVSDLDDETRAALALVVMTLGSQSLSSAPAPAPGRGRRTTNGEWAAQDPAGWRHIRRGTSMFAIPPAPGH